MKPILQKARILALPVVLVLVSACASGVVRPTDMEAYKPALTGDQKAGKLTVELAPAAQKMAGDNLTFDENQLLSTIHRALVANDALTRRPDGSLPVIEVHVTSVRARSAFAAIMFGFMAGDDHIKGDVLVRSVDGTELQRFSVNASYAFGGIGGGQDGTRMNWLYENFAKRVAEEVTGTVSPGASSG